MNRRHPEHQRRTQYFKSNPNFNKVRKEEQKEQIEDYEEIIDQLTKKSEVPRIRSKHDATINAVKQKETIKNKSKKEVSSFFNDLDSIFTLIIL